MFRYRQSRLLLFAIISNLLLLPLLTSPVVA